MGTGDYSGKSSVEEIRKRFDQDVERFSNLDTGQKTVPDAALMMELCTAAAHYACSEARELLDLGCGAGNYTLKMLAHNPELNCTLNDLSVPMLDRAKERVSSIAKGKIQLLKGDLRELNLPEEHYDIVLAAAVFHHLRDDSDWEKVFQQIFRALKPGGGLWISDLISHDSTHLSALFQDRYSAYLEELGGMEYREKVWEYIEAEDSPRSLGYQLELMKKVGFRHVEVLHKNGLFAAFGGIKP
jgi:tRNA (cmo5U34)-methyltransferase